ncbi:MAG: GNAT family N-acetyltransferase [Candidatus Zixiibacteriota bacterium]
MKPNELTIDNSTITIKLMDNSYIIGTKFKKSGIDFKIKCCSESNPQVALYFQKLIGTYGTGAIMAWKNRSLIGFLPFYPLDCGIPKINCICGPVDISIGKMDSISLIPLNELKRKVLEVQCLSVNWNYYRKGIGTAMTKYLIKWAKFQGWNKIQGCAFSDNKFMDAYKWIPSIHFWQKSGFQIDKSEEKDMGELGNVQMSDFSINLKEI